MTSVEKAYVGAVIDTQGYVGSGGGIYVTNTDVEIHSALLRLTGLGRVTTQGVPGSRSARKQVYQWYTRKLETAELLVALQPFSYRIAGMASRRLVA